ncbi:MAG: sigma-70 family RNA polymerase sigma factor [Actinobacteria bacterium]|nr:sigma-70 family RNA polymerase sigma factor [Actinomycetota bacterium]
MSAEVRRDDVVGRVERRDFDAVYASELTPLTRVAYLVVHDRAVAEELAQEAFVRLFERFDEVRNPAGFLRTVVVRLGINWAKRHRMEADRLRLVGPLHSASASSGEQIDGMWACLARLSPERAAVLVLRFYEDRSFDEIGVIVGASAATVRSRARRALADLRKELER